MEIYMAEFDFGLEDITEAMAYRIAKDVADLVLNLTGQEVYIYPRFES